MNKVEAREVLRLEMASLRSRGWTELKEFIHSPEISLRSGESGTEYQLEIQAFWDRPGEADSALRVISSIDDGGFFSALLPLSDDFIIHPDGTVLGMGDASSP